MIYVTGTPADIERPFVLFRNLLAVGTLSASAGVGANATDENTFDFWAPGTSDPTLAVTLTSAESADACAIVGHNLGTEGATLLVQRWDGSAWVTVASVSPPDNRPFCALFPSASSAQWRILVQGTTAAVISGAVIGPRLVIPGYVAAPHSPSWASKRVEILGGVSRGGQFIGNRIKRQGASMEVSFTPLDIEWVSVTARTFIEHHDTGRPFVFGSSPADFPEDVAYCWRAGPELRPQIRDDGEYMDISLSLEAYTDA